MPVDFHSSPKSTLAGDRPTRKTSFAAIANAIKAAGSASSAQHMMQSLPHYGIKGRHIKPVGSPKRID